MEIWDGYNIAGEKVGIDLIRGKKIPKDIFHCVVVIIVVHEDGTYLLMQRDYNKTVFPGKWETGASGCLQKGESFEEGAKRELLEETGILGENLIFMESFVKEEYQTIYKIYLHTCSSDKNSITLQQGETIDFKWVSKVELLGIVDTDEFISPSIELMKRIIMTQE